MLSPLRVQKLVENLAEGEEDLFKLGLVNELNIRKQDLCKQLSSAIFEQFNKIANSDQFVQDKNVQKLIKLSEEAGKNKSIKIEFKNASIINISESDFASIKLLFDNLNDKNKVILAKNLFEEPSYFKRTLEFAKKIKGLIT